MKLVFLTLLLTFSFSVLANSHFDYYNLDDLQDNESILLTDQDTKEAFIVKKKYNKKTKSKSISVEKYKLEQAEKISENRIVRRFNLKNIREIIQEYVIQLMNIDLDPSDPASEQFIND